METKLSQVARLYNLLSDGNAHSTNEIQDKIYGREHLGYANIHGRITDIRKKYGVKIINFKDDKFKSLSWYQIKPIEFQEIPKEDIPPEPKFEEMPEVELWRGLENRIAEQGKLI
jgi:hypothetical protein